MFGVTAVGLDTSSHVIASLWPRVPILKAYDFNLFNWNIVNLISLFFILVFIYASLRWFYKVSIVDVFNLKLAYLPFIIKLCAVLIIVMILNYLWDYGLFSQPEELRRMKSMDAKNLIIDSLLRMFLGPIVEESIYRGLIYAPLYRKVGRYFAIILTSFVWTFGHFYDLPTSIGIFILGLFLGWLYDRSGSLLHPLLFHMVRNNWLLLYYF